MADLKKSWKQTAKSFILAFNDLGVSLADSAKVGVDKAVEWARKDNPHVQAEGTEIPTEDPVVEPIDEEQTEEATIDEEQPEEAPKAE